MNTIQALKRLYSFFLSLYPLSYQKEYSEERLAVLEQVLLSAVGRGQTAVWVQFIKELWALPGSIACEYLRVGNLKASPAGTPGWQSPLPWRLVFIPLVMFTLLIADRILYATPAVEELGPIKSLLVLFFLLAFIIGVLKGYPAWSLPVLGVIFGGFSFYILQALLLRLASLPPFGFLLDDPRWQASWLMQSFFVTGFQWLVILVINAVLLIPFGLLPPARSFWKRMSQDWSLPVFFLYSITPFLMFANLDNYRFAQPFSTAAFLLLALGTCYFLRTADPGRRFAFLLACFTLAMGMDAIGRWVVVPLQGWALDRLNGIEIERQMQTVQIVYNWFWMLLGMLFLARLGLSVRPEKPNSSKVHTFRV